MIAITGCARSGTTALCEVFNTDQRILVLNEIGWLTRWETNISDRLTNVSLSKNARPQFKKNRAFLQNKNLNPDKIVNLSIKNKWTGKDLYSYIVKNTTAEIIGDKMPLEYVNDLDKLTKKFKDTKFIILIRDGRSVISSQIENWSEDSLDHWTRPNIEEAEYLWLNQTINLQDRVSKLSAQEASRVLLVRYEALVVEPDRILKVISDFVGLDPPIKNNDLIKPVFTDKWKAKFPDMMNRLSADFKSYLKKLGYY